MLKYCNSNDYSLKLNLFLQKTMKQLRCSVHKSTNPETSSTIFLVDIPSDIQPTVLEMIDLSPVAPLKTREHSSSVSPSCFWVMEKFPLDNINIKNIFRYREVGIPAIQ